MRATEREYEYKARWSTIVVAAILFGAAAIVLAAKAESNDRGLVINGIVELSTDGATLFYTVLSAVSIVFVILAGILACLRIAAPQRVALTRESVVVPRSSWSRRETSVGFRDITGLSVSEVYGQRFLKVLHAHGKVTLAASMLPRREDFDDICGEIAARVEAARDPALQSSSRG